MDHHPILILGGGLSGLALAHDLLRSGRQALVIEARDRVGGRILSAGGMDLGPAWIWPGQPRIAALLADLGLGTFPQVATGHMMYEDGRGPAQTVRNPGSMAGSLRVAGGLARVTAALADGLPKDNLRLGCKVTALRPEAGRIRVETTEGTMTAGRVIMCLPPRLAAGLLPDLSDADQAAMVGVPTWMAGHAKAVAVYDRPFWRDAGLSGDAMSHLGPLVELHDASDVSGTPAAIFGFFGVPPQARQDEAALRAATLDQLARLFGPAAATPVALHLKDWARDLLTATDHDLAPLTHHPTYAALPPLWDGRLIFGGTETAPTFGGFIEGALEAAEAALARLHEI
ncbi:flavin monoamine oxidase family protein [Jannaschia pohangensis]|uniref:Monoamine oxidase n=1 Tax=Jannaschia pohangensis TaxID=390807 RepID=A0A1I3T5L1_9RHOB|nr:FAD-dependent oxidoreductase [Jannaschia pohangensis]SFJ65539.1 monoamine oxidase [Jannaschia pohangensis]